MTDGENVRASNGNELNSLNGTWYSAYGRGKAASNNRFGTNDIPNAMYGARRKTWPRSAQNIKANNIILYTVAFRVCSDVDPQQVEGVCNDRGSLQLRCRRCCPCDHLQSHRGERREHQHLPQQVTALGPANSKRSFNCNHQEKQCPTLKHDPIPVFAQITLGAMLLTSTSHLHARRLGGCELVHELRGQRVARGLMT